MQPSSGKQGKRLAKWQLKEPFQVHGMSPAAHALSLLAEWLFDGVGDRSSSRWQDLPILAAQHVRNIANVIKELDVDVLGKQAARAGS